MKTRDFFAFLSLLVMSINLSQLVAQSAGPQAASDAAPGPVAGGIGFGPLASAGTEEHPKNARTIIESEDGATFENASNYCGLHGTGRGA